MPGKPGRPAIGSTVKTSLGPHWIDLLNRITEQMTQFTDAVRMYRNTGHSLTPSEHRAWDRSGVIANLIMAAAPQFAHYVLGDPTAVKAATPCPLCWGYVDGPHRGDCGYFGPYAERDPRYDDRLRAALHRAGSRSKFRNVDGYVAEVYDRRATAETPPSD